MSNVDVFGKIGDRLAVEVFVSQIAAAKARIERIAALHAMGKNSDPETDPRDVTEALRLYDYLLAHPQDFKAKMVRSILGALPITLAANPVLVNRDVAVHLDINYFYKDYSSIVPKEVAERFTIVPVQVFKVAPKIKDDPWRDVIITKIKNKELSLEGREFKPGVYTHCVGITAVWGGTNIPCPHEDQARIVDQPRHRCDSCTKEFKKIRTKMRRTGRAGVVENGARIVDDLLGLLK